MLAKTTDIIEARNEIVEKLVEARKCLKRIEPTLSLELHTEQSIKKDETLIVTKPLELLYSYYLDIRKDLLDFDGQYWFLKDEEIEARLRGDISV